MGSARQWSEGSRWDGAHGHLEEMLVTTHCLPTDEHSPNWLNQTLLSLPCEVGSYQTVPGVSGGGGGGGRENGAVEIQEPLLCTKRIPLHVHH